MRNVNISRLLANKNVNFANLRDFEVTGKGSCDLRLCGSGCNKKIHGSLFLWTGECLKCVFFIRTMSWLDQTHLVNAQRSGVKTKHTSPDWRLSFSRAVCWPHPVSRGAQGRYTSQVFQQENITKSIFSFHKRRPENISNHQSRWHFQFKSTSFGKLQKRFISKQTEKNTWIFYWNLNVIVLISKLFRFGFQLEANLCVGCCWILQGMWLGTAFFKPKFPAECNSSFQEGDSFWDNIDVVPLWDSWYVPHIWLADHFSDLITELWLT